MPPLHLWPLAFFGCGCLVTILMRLEQPAKATLSAFFFFFAFHLVALHWISNALLVDWQAYLWLLPVSFFGLPAVLSLIPALTLWPLCRISRANGMRRAMLVITGLIIAEGLRAWAFTGFPWNMPAHIWKTEWDIAAAAAMIGMMGVSLLTLLILAAPAIIRVFPVAGTVMLCLPLALLFTLEKPPSPANFDPIRIIGIQPNIPQSEKWSPDLQIRNLNRRLDLSRNAVSNPAPEPVLLIWPETALSYNSIHFPEFRQALPDILREGDVLLTGYLGYRPDQGYSNSVLMMNRNAEILKTYDKFHLVPFGEYIPFSDLIPVGPLVGIEGFIRGEGVKTLAVEGLPTLQPLICYEAIFPWNINHQADILINVTNDAWYGDGWGPRQHLSHVAWRALETGIPVIRVAGTGISAIIDGSGKITQHTDYNHTAMVDIRLP